MTMYLERHTHFTTPCRLSTIINRGCNVAVYRLKTENKYIAVTDNWNRPVMGLTEVVIKESRPEPLWKQDMRMRMMQRPRNIVTNRIHGVQEIDIDEAAHHNIEVYVAR